MKNFDTEMVTQGQRWNYHLTLIGIITWLVADMDL